jgi:hypothetical protein
MSTRHFLILAMIVLVSCKQQKPPLTGISVTCPTDPANAEVEVSVTNSEANAASYVVVISVSNYLLSYSAEPEQVCSESLPLAGGESGNALCTLGQITSANLITVDVTSADRTFSYTCPTTP